MNALKKGKLWFILILITIFGYMFILNNYYPLYIDDLTYLIIPGMTF